MRLHKLLLLVSGMAFVMAGCSGKQAASESASVAAGSSETAAETGEKDTEAKDTEADEPKAEAGIKKPDNYPKRPIQITVPTAAGGSSDVLVRSLITSIKMDQPVTVVNKEGAGGTVGTAEVALQKADGYNLLLGIPAAFYIQPNMKDLAYKIEDFRHIAQISPEEPLVIVVTPDSPIKTFEDFKNLMDKGEALKSGTANPGSVGYCGFYDLASKMGAEGRLEMVPYNGGAECLTSLLGGHIDIANCDLLEAIPRIENNQVVPLAVFGDERCAALPDVPCLKELGYEGTSCFVAVKWISVRKDTPDDVVEYLKSVINTAVMDEEYKAFMKSVNGLDTYVVPEDELTEKLISYRTQYGELLTDMGLAKK